MNAKHYLMRYGLIKARLATIEANIVEIRAELVAISDTATRSSWPDGQPRGTGATDPTGNEASRIADRTAQLRDKLRGQLLDLEVSELKARSELWRERCEIEQTIAAVTDPALNQILHLRYVGGYTFEYIAVELNYTYRHILNLHGAALEEVARILEEK